jgi:type VI protein secretion system component VasK
VVAQAIRPWVNVLANVLPYLVLTDIAIRILSVWVQWWFPHGKHVEYLPGTFYWLALGLFALSIIPGYWFVTWLINRCLQQTEPAQTFTLTSSPVLEPLSANCRQLDELIRQAESLRRTATQLRHNLAPHLPGAGTVQEPPAPSENVST